MRENTIRVKGAREHNLKNIEVELPREQLIVVTGLSGSGKSSLAFDTIFAEGQRRFLESLDTFSRRFAAQLTKPDVDFVFGLSPVISIQQKTVNKNPRSTIGTMTDIYDYLRLLYATVGVGACPRCGHTLHVRTPIQIVEHVLCLPEGTVVEFSAPVVKIFGEDYPYLFGDIRSKGCRRVRIDGVLHDLSDAIDLDESETYDIEAVFDKVVVKKNMRDVEKSLIASVQNGLRLGDGFLRLNVLNPDGVSDLERFYGEAGCPDHGIVLGDLLPYYFSFNEADSACTTCLGLGIHLKVHPDLLVPDKSRSIRGGAVIPDAFKYDKNSWSGRLMYSLAEHVGFSLDTPFCDLPPEIVQTIFYGSSEKFPLLLPPGGDAEGSGKNHIGSLFRFDGIITDIERRYRRYRKEKVAHTWMEEYLRRVMVEHTCPDCQGTKLKPQRLLITVNGETIHALSRLPLSELKTFLDTLPETAFARQANAGKQVRNDITARLGLLIDIGLDYLNLGRQAATLSGGESQRIRLSTQISSGLMGMLYVLDEPSIGLHPKDNIKLIGTLKRLRDIGNTVIVVEHDEETIRAADHIVEVGPGPGIHGGQITAQGTLADILTSPDSLTGQFLSGRRRIETPTERRQPTERHLRIRGARQHNLQNLDVTIPLGLLVCVTGASGSGKSTLINETLYKRLYALYHDSRVFSGEHDTIEGTELLRDVINIDQTPLGRSPRSNPATYIGFYDEIRQLFAAQPEALSRGYTPSRFSFNVRGGRCEICAGEGMITTQLQFMPDVETPCQACKGTRYNEETLEVLYNGKNIAEVLAMSMEEAACFFKERPLIAHKIAILNQLGLGYIQLGQSATTLSGGEAQRVKLANELGKIKRGGKNLYILDEPTTGLHLADIQRLLDCLNRLVDAGNTVVVIEHHLDVIKTADWIIDLGPEGGKYGGEIVAQGTPEEVSRSPRSHTGRFLQNVLGR